ncbi:MAG: ATP-binding protein [Bacillota bacterium]|jgi:DNA polymerase III delta' subunit
MRLPDILGQDDALRILDAEIRSGTMSHAYLLWGPRGSGRTLVARRLALAAGCSLKDQAPPESPLWYCGECANCAKIVSGVHPDFSVIVPSGNTIKIAQIREMQWRISLKANESELKTWLIDDADQMTEEAQNCLLKVLEEPPGRSLIILVAQDPQMMLPTIASRCHSIRLGTVDMGAMAEWAGSRLSLSPERARFLAALSGGLPGRLVSLASDHDYFELRGSIISKVRSVMWCGDGALALDASEGLLDELKKAYARAQDADAQGEAASREALEIATPTGACDCMAGWFRDLFVLSLTGDDELVINRDYMKALEEDAARGSPALFGRWTIRVMQTARALDANANARLAMDDLMLCLALAR